MKPLIAESHSSLPETPCASHLLTFDVEHWYEGFRYRGLDGWQAYPPRDDKMVERLLDKLGETGQRSTMFFTGRYAEEFPHVVKRAAQEGHEIASHSYSHTVLSRLKNIDEFREDLLRSVAILEDISGCKVKGYRAPKWSISDKNRQDVLSVLVEAGFEYDSSVFPKLFGHAGKAVPHKITLAGGATIWEIPASTYAFFGLHVPVAGGLYFRFFPQWFNRLALSSKSSADHPGMIYLHPYDLDDQCPQLPTGNILFQWLRYYGVGDAWCRLDLVLRRYKFTSLLEWLRSQNSTLPPL